MGNVFVKDLSVICIHAEECLTVVQMGFKLRATRDKNERAFTFAHRVTSPSCKKIELQVKHYWYLGGFSGLRKIAQK